MKNKKLRNDSKAVTPRIEFVSETLTFGEVFPDGKMIELARAESRGAPIRLLTWDSKKAEIGEKSMVGGQIFSPGTPHSPIPQRLRLPSRPVPCSSTRELFDEVSRLILRYEDLPGSSIALITCFIFTTWLVDCLPLAPILWVVVPPMAAGSQLLQLLGLFCRRSLLVSDFSLTTFHSLPMELRPTLLTEIVGLDKTLQKAIRASANPGAIVPMGGRVLDSFCAKAIFSLRPLADPSLVRFPLHIALAPTRRQMPLLDRKTSEAVAAEFQAKFLMYRLMVHHKVKAPIVDLGDLSAPLQNLARILTMSVPDDVELQEQIVSNLRAHDLDFRAQQSSGLEAMILEACLFACHEGKRMEISSAEVARATNEISRGRHLNLEISAESVGWRLKGIGLLTEPIRGGAHGLFLSEETRRRIHDLSALYGVRSASGNPSGSCRFCAKSGKEER
jgi:hypothetical protein